MARPNKPWYRKSRQSWFCTIDGKTHNLGPDEDDAGRKFHKLMADRGIEVPADHGEYLNTLFREFLAWAAKNLGKRTYDGYFEFLDDFDVEHPGILVSDLRGWHLDAWIAKHSSWGPTRRRNATTAVLRALNWAVERRRIESNPIGRYSKPKAISRTQAVSEAEFETILAHTDERFADLITVSYDSGARPQEVKGLEARHIDWKRFRAVIPVEEAKGKKRSRAIYLPTDRCMEILRRLAKKYPEGPLFRSRNGNPWTKNSVADRFRRLRKHVGRQITQYEFRHGWITRALKASMDSHIVAKMAGHQDTRMIDTVYSHVADDPKYMLEQARMVK